MSERRRDVSLATIGDLYDRAVLHGGARTAIADGARRFSYAELGANALKIAGALQALGVGRAQRVAFLMVNCAEYVFCEYAVAKTGAARVPLAVLLGDDDLVYILNFSRCDVLIYHAKFADRLRQIRSQLDFIKTFICVGAQGAPAVDGDLTLEALLMQPTPPCAPCPIDPEDIAGIYFTGGTTGRPKGVMLSHRSWYYTYYAEMLEFGIADGEAFVFVTPMTHASGCLILPVLLRQGCCIILDRFDPDLLLDTIQKHRATATLLVPTMIYVLLDHAGRGAYDLSSLKNVLYGASAIAPERLKQALASFGPIFTQFFGQTEAPMVLTALSRQAHVDAAFAQDDVLMSAGRAAYQVSLRLVDDDGRDVARGDAGEVVVRSLNMMSGYLDNSEATAAAIRDGWLYTGDIARISNQGLVTIIDRKKDMIVSGGLNVYPREVEDALFEHPAVKHAAVVGAPHEKWGEEVRAIVVLHDGAQVGAAELIEFVKVRKGSVAAPKAIEFWEAIPLTNLGKIDKKAIRARFWRGQERMV
jgi:acyl-CoA synthetase (AMP-forming)/AMP-acid ligase II